MEYNNTNQNKTVALKAYNKKELQALFGISLHILNKWIDSIADKLGSPVCGLYSVKQVQMLIDRFGVPDKSYRPAA